MKIHNQILYIIFAFSYITAQANTTFKLTPAARERIDSILLEIKDMPAGRERIMAYQTISFEYTNTPTEIYYLKKAYNEAMDVKEYGGASYMLGNMTSNYFNRNMKDSLFYYTEELKKISAKAERYGDLFDALGYCCRYYIAGKQYNMALNEANDINKLAEKVNSKIGLVVSFDNMGMIYMSTGRVEDAYKIYVQVYNIVRNISDRDAYTLEYLENIVHTLILMENVDDMKFYLDKYMALYKKCMNEKVQSIYPDASGYFESWINRNFTLYFSMKNDLKRAKLFYDKIEGDKRQQQVDLYNYHYVSAYYNYKNGNYNKALADIDEYIKQEVTPQALLLRGDIYFSLGKTDKSREDYRYAYNFNDSIAQDKIHLQVNDTEMHTKLIELELKNRYLEFKKNRQYLIGMITITVVLIMLLVVLSTFYLRNNKLRKRLEKSHHLISEAMAKAEIGDKVKSLFLENISHEIRTPLNAIVGFSQIITENTPEDSEEREFVDIIKDSTDNLLQLLTKIVETSKMEAEGIHLKKEYFDIVSFTDTVLKELRRDIKPNIEFNFNTDLKSMMINSDKAYLYQVFENVIDNADKFTNSGSISVSLEEAGHNIIFAVEDTGIGIAKNQSEQIFKQFEKINSFTQGCGLGLSMCRYIMNKLGGKIYVDNEYTKGARFVVEIPM